MRNLLFLGYIITEDANVGCYYGQFFQNFEIYSFCFVVAVFDLEANFGDYISPVVNCILHLEIFSEIHV